MGSHPPYGATSSLLGQGSLLTRQPYSHPCPHPHPYPYSYPYPYPYPTPTPTPTPHQVREGLNLLPFEYLLAREHFPGGPGAIVVSEFSASARVLSGGVPCNPWSIRKAGP